MVPISELASNPRQPTYRLIANGLRNQILTGQLVPGQQLPPKPKLMEIWQSSSFTIHTAVQTLIKEGWIESIRGAGTFVAPFKNRFACAGIYHGRDIFSQAQASFSRMLHTCLLKQLNALGKEALVFLDSRAENKQGTILPALADAIFHRRIQCLIAPTLNDVDARTLTRVNLPTAFTAHRSSAHQVDFDLQSLLRQSVRSLADQGCRSIGLISNAIAPFDINETENFNSFYPSFYDAVKRECLITREEWIRRPKQSLADADFERFGYDEFVKLWSLLEKPDGVIIYPEGMVRGASMAVLKLGVKVQEEMKFVLHRNAHNHFLCPFPAIWVISDEALIAAEFIKMIQRQFEGERVSPVLVPYSIESSDAFA